MQNITIDGRFYRDRELNYEFALQHINAKSITIYDPSIREIPNEILNFRKLKSLDLCGCTNLEKLPESISKLKELTSIELTNCKNLKTLPRLDREDFKSLLNIDLVGCDNLIFTKDLRKNLDDLKKNGCFVYYPEGELKYMKHEKSFQEGLNRPLSPIAEGSEEGSPATSPRETGTEEFGISRKGSIYREAALQSLSGSLPPSHDR